MRLDIIVISASIDQTMYNLNIHLLIDVAIIRLLLLYTSNRTEDVCQAVL